MFAGRPGHWVPARKIYTEADDGLHQPWEGLVFMNPPFGGRNGHVPWLRKFLEHGNGIAIVRAYTSSAWWHDHMPRAELICFPCGKTKFIRPDGSIGRAPGHGVALIGMGATARTSLEASGLGMCWEPQQMLNQGSRSRPTWARESAPASCRRTNGYDRLGSERDDDIKVLCRDCHKTLHGHAPLPDDR